MLPTVILIIHVFVAIALVGIILLQRSEGGALGMGGGGGGSAGSFMSVRGTANLLTKTTSVLAALFMATSLLLAILAGNHGQGTSILDQLPTAPAVPSDRVTVPSIPAPATPQVPLAK